MLKMSLGSVRFNFRRVALATPIAADRNNMNKNAWVIHRVSHDLPEFIRISEWKFIAG